MTPGRGHRDGGGSHEEPISDNIVSTTTAIGGTTEEVWEAEESSDIEVCVDCVTIVQSICIDYVSVFIDCDKILNSLRL